MPYKDGNWYASTILVSTKLVSHENTFQKTGFLDICRCAFHDAPIFKVVAFNVALFDAKLFHSALCYYNII